MNENLLLIAILFLLITGFGLVIYSLFKKISSLSSVSNDTTIQYLQNQLNSLGNSVDYKLGEVNKTIQEQLQLSNQRLQTQNTSNNELLHKINEYNAKILQEVSEKLVKVEDTNRQVVNFAEQLQSLENILRNPKQRGILGEYFLETMLSNVLPAAVFQMQYGFRDGVIVDAVIFSKDKVIPIDAKFSLEAYTKLAECKHKELVPAFEKQFIQDVKKRIDEVNKYVKPEENTIDIAFMFVPADGVYQEIIRLGCTGEAGDIISYAYSKKVVIVSPTSFFAYLQTVIQAINTIQIEERVQEIVTYLNQSSRYLREFEENMNKLGKHITTMTSAFNRASNDAKKLSGRIVKITNNEKNLLSLERISDTESED